MADVDIIHELVKDAFLPRMFQARQIFPRPVLLDLVQAVRIALHAPAIAASVHPGMRVAISAGSRGVANIAVIIKEVCAFITGCGAKPMIIPAMGSHGGATAEGQKKILYGLDITEAMCDAPIVSSMEVKVIGTTDDGHPVFIDRHAAEADGIIIVGRIKAHTDFRGPYESGLMKMMAIGLGKQHGAEAFHAMGPEHMARLVPLYGQAIIRNAPILFGLGILENAYDETCELVAIPAEDIVSIEPLLLEKAKRLMGRILVDETDVLIVDRIGKDISGDGMDPNVAGTFATPFASGGIRARKRVVLDLTKGSHGSIVGLGMADATTKRCVERADLVASYANSLTCTIFAPSKIPLIFQNDRQAIQACLKYCGGNDANNPKVVRIRDTLHLEKIWLSEAFFETARKHPGMEIIGEPAELRFDGAGNLKNNGGY
jgi:hypothetical protein